MFRKVNNILYFLLQNRLEEFKVRNIIEFQTNSSQIGHMPNIKKVGGNGELFNR
mgnify:CR=1 FL=1